MASDEEPKESGPEAPERKLVPSESPLVPPSPPAGFVPLAEADRAELELVRALIAEREIQGFADLRGVVADACALYDVCDGKISGSRFLSALLDRTAPAVRPAMLADLRRYLDELALSEPAGPIVDTPARVQ